MTPFRRLAPVAANGVDTPLPPRGGVDSEAIRAVQANAERAIAQQTQVARDVEAERLEEAQRSELARWLAARARVVRSSANRRAIMSGACAFVGIALIAVVATRSAS
jgi:hypothetical protein